jgi:hypothetical protein
MQRPMGYSSKWWNCPGQEGLYAAAALVGGGAQFRLGGARFRRLARDYERLPETLIGFHFLVFAILMLIRFVALMVQSA